MTNGTVFLLCRQVSWNEKGVTGLPAQTSTETERETEEENMRKFLSVMLILVMVLSLAGCGSDEDGDKKDDRKNETTSPAADKPGDDKPGNDKPGEGGIVIGVTGDKVTLPVGSEAHDYWHAETSVRNYEFDASGKCIKNETIYYLDDPANKQKVNDFLTGGGWEPSWSDDGSYFMLGNGFLDYTDTEDAFDYFASRYLAYTIKYEGGATQRVEAAGDAEKDDDFKNIFGLELANVQSLLGEKFTIVTRQRNALYAQLGTGATVDQMNELCAKMFEACKPIAEEGKMYTYLGKYGDEITEAPSEESEFSSPEFHYFYGGKEIKVVASLSAENDYMLSLELAQQR